jgi:hypothetical protein
VLEAEDERRMCGPRVSAILDEHGICSSLLSYKENAGFCVGEAPLDFKMGVSDYMWSASVVLSKLV